MCTPAPKGVKERALQIDTGDGRRLVRGYTDTHACALRSWSRVTDAHAQVCSTHQRVALAVVKLKIERHTADDDIEDLQYVQEEVPSVRDQQKKIF